MTFVLSHTTALEVMRLKRFPLHLAHRDPELRLPRKAPTSAEVESWASSSPMVSQLRRPICLLAATCGASVRNDRFEVRAASTALLAASLIRLDEETAIVSPELLALELAATATRLELVLLLCELCGLYAMQPGSDLGLIQRDAPLTTLEKLATYARESGRVPGKRALSEACRSSFELCASPMEAKLACRVAWPRMHGGYNVPILGMNSSLEVERISRRFSDSHVRKPDILLSLPTTAAPGLCLDYNGAVHERGVRPMADLERMNELLAFGMKPYVIGRDQYRGTSYLDGLVDGVLRKELGLRAPRHGADRAALELARREALLAELDVVDGLSWGVSEDASLVRKAKADVDEALDRCRAGRKKT